MSNDNKRLPIPDDALPDGTRLFLKVGRANGKTMMTLEFYRKLYGISDEEWAAMKGEVMRRLGYPEEM